MTDIVPQGGPSAPRAGGSDGRITVNLTRKASAALAEPMELAQDNKTDTVNKALQVYALLQRVEAAGGAIYLREKAGAQQERLHIV